MGTGNRTLDRYDDPNFTILRQSNIEGSNVTSLTDFCKFVSRNKAIVHAVHWHLVSAASAAGGSLVAVRSRSTSAATIKSYSLTSATSVGSYGTMTLGSLNTVTSIGDYIACRVKSNAKGKWNITYEWQLLPPTLLISK